MERDRAYHRSFLSSQVNVEANWRPQSEMTLSKSLKQRKTLWKKREVIPSVVMDFFNGQRITPSVSPWSTMTRRESKPEDKGRSVMRS